MLISPIICRKLQLTQPLFYMDLCYNFEMKRLLLLLFYVKPLLILFVCVFIHEKKFSVSASSGIF